MTGGHYTLMSSHL